MEELERRWRRAVCRPLHRSPVITDEGVLLGFGSVLIRRSQGALALPSDGERALCLLFIVARQAQPNHLVEVFRRAIGCWAFPRQIFAENYSSIGIHVLPYPGGVPRPNPRIR